MMNGEPLPPLRVLSAMSARHLARPVCDTAMQQSGTGLSANRDRVTNNSPRLIATLHATEAGPEPLTL